ncbi:hypothetical protein HW41_04515 [Apilactobacillus kunkeei]|uniref:hypothetical protein n=1 Tax=Apilactobacillus kunkeei TaxID=148814 RepID=UPI00059B1720|nr:hypothetical protein [Apilactobacillus kunkeei]KIM18531.1 hypothetical protein HW41_04515 [Apilactobacillus kunkeei]
MKKQTKNILTKLALVAAPFAVAATITTSAVSANADDNTFGDWVMTPADKANIEKANALTNEGRIEDHSTQAESEAQGAAFQKKQEAQLAKDNARNQREFGGDTSQATTKPAKKQAVKKTTKKATKKHVAKKKVVKKHVAKKRVVKKHARKHARRLFRIRVKAHRIYAYKTSNFRHHKGRRAERKGTKLYVYGKVRRGHTTYYKVYGGRFITSSHHYVTRVAR